MGKMNDKRQVEQQYSDDKNLSVRLGLHEKYSTAEMSLADWLFSQYAITKPCRILELGCGNAALWNGRMEALPEGTLLVLSDFSWGMVDSVWAKMKTNPNVLVQRIDIQEIPFADESFDIVIANYMLYHVPELKRALREVARVLRADGTFFAATNGSGGMRAYLHEALQQFNPACKAFCTVPSFHLQNGAACLSEFFSQVRVREFQDALRITETQDLVDWIMSTITISEITEQELDGLYDFLEALRQREGGIIQIPKETGVFVSKK